jgi:hypothetical protein
MSQTSKMVVQPRKIIVKDQEWTSEEIQALKDLFSGRPAVQLPKRDIRESVLLQKAMVCEIVQNVHVQAGDEATLHLAQIGYDMMAAI